MKTLKNAAILILLSVGFAYAQDKIVVQGEKKLNTDFRKYKTFGWLQSDKPGSQLVAYSFEEFRDPSTTTSSSNKMNKKARKKNKNGEVVVYSYLYTIPSMDTVINNALVNTVNDEMEGRGYREDEVNPDLLVSYKIFDYSTKIKGYTEGPIKASGKEFREVKDTITYNLKPGTVLITMLDARTGVMVWEGYASGVAHNSDVINDKLKVKEAINLIFKRYEFRGDKYSMN